MQFNRIAIAIVIVLTSALLVSSVAAQQGPYIQINNGDTISVTQNERPNIVIQFGSGQTFQQDLGILCIADPLAPGDIEFTGRVQTHGAFPSFSIAPAAPGIEFANKAISFPSAFSYLGIGNEFTDFRPGQNRNVSFQVRSTSGQGGQVLCALVNGAATAALAQQLGLGPTNLDDAAVIQAVIDTGLAFDAVNIDIR